MLNLVLIRLIWVLKHVVSLKLNCRLATLKKKKVVAKEMRQD